MIAGHRLVQVLAVSGVLLFSVASARANEDPPTLVWRGCGVSKKAFMEACAVEYEKQTGVKIRLSGGGAQLGIETAAAGGADLGGTCRACLKKLNEDQLDVKLAAVAWDALTVIVCPENPIDNITRDQLQAVLEQRMTNWNELGGPDEQIIVVVRRGKTSGVGYGVRALMLDDTEADFGPTALRLNSVDRLNVWWNDSQGRLRSRVYRVPANALSRRYQSMGIHRRPRRFPAVSTLITDRCMLPTVRARTNRLTNLSIGYSVPKDSRSSVVSQR